LDRFSEFAQGVDALIGMDMLSLSNFSLDFVAMNVVFRPLDDPASSVFQKSHSNCIVVGVEVQGHPVFLILDTGAQGIFLYEKRLRSQVPHLRVAGRMERGKMANRMNVKQVTLPEVRLGPTMLAPTVFLIQDPPENVLAGIGGIIGTGAFKASRIDFNFDANSLSWK